jgi:hypothetical protein
MAGLGDYNTVFGPEFVADVAVGGLIVEPLAPVHQVTKLGL